ncbi:MAG: phosphoribosylanthranilate isomerase [Anaerolineales bacterium]
MIVKICGIKTVEEALAAVDAGAEMLGFNFYPPSPRYITPQTCAGILAGLTACRYSFAAVGVFVNHSPQQVLAALEYCGLDLAQLSGDEPVEHLKLLNGKAFKAVRPRSPGEADLLLAEYNRARPPALLVDAHVSGAYGGAGLLGNWALARYVAEQAPVILAGGLDPDNVALAVRRVRPWGVDVASGVESTPGVKDAAKIAAFVRAAHSIQG